MRRWYRQFAFCLFTLITNALTTQVDVERLFDGEIPIEEQSVLIEYLEQLELSPMNVNEASAQELSTLPWISPLVAVRIVQYRHEIGEFKRLEDLQHVRGIKSVYDHIAPFLTTGRQPISASVQGRHRLSSRREASKAFQQNTYCGSKEKLMHRFKGDVAEHIRFGFLAEKDPGERVWNDLAVGYVAAELPGESTKIIGGHFSAEFGQGLVFAAPYRMFKGSDPIASVKRRSRGLYPFLSSAENYAFNGVALSSRIHHVEWHAFTSRQKRDARIVDGKVLSLVQTGLHRTAGERSIKDQLHENVHGMAVKAFIGSGQITALWQRAFYQSSFISGAGFRALDFAGKTNQVFGVNADFSCADVNFFAEAAHSRSGGMAWCAGLWLDLSPIEIVMLYRHYDPDYHNFYALAFGERPNTNNETGAYMGFRYQLRSHTTVGFYLDQWRSPWPHTFIPMPSTGWDMMFSLEHDLSALANVRLQYRTEKKQSGETGVDDVGNSFRYLEQPQRSMLRCQLDYDTHRQVWLRTRFELSAFSKTGVSVFRQNVGTLIYQDIRWHANRKISVQCRWTFFDAPSFEKRFYQFENDLPGVMRIKMLDGRGKRWYVVCRYAITPNVKLSFKYENLYIDDDTSIGSGNDIIFSQFENIFSAQIDWLF